MPGNNYGESSMAHIKNRSNDRKAFCILYLSTMAAASIAVSVQAMDESKDGLTAVVHDMLLGTLYATSTGILFFITIYFCLRRKQTFEAAQNSTGPVPFIVKYSCHGEPINLYLRIGLAVFTLMSIGQNSVQIAEIAGDRSTHWPEVYKSAFEMSFYVCQTTFILVYHRIVILHNNELFGASLIHILSTNLCMWADVTVEKIRTTLHLDEGDVLGGNYSSNCQKSSTKQASFYLLPAVSEYCLLSAALIYEITTRIGEASYIELEEGEGHSKKGIKERSSVWLNMIKSGYWSPIVIVSVIVILAIATGVSPKEGPISYWKCAVLFTEEMFLNCMGICVTLAAFLKIRHLKFTIPSQQSNTDEFQLYIAFFFTVNYLVATVALTSYLQRNNDSPHKLQDLLMGRLALDLLELLEVILQTYLIQDCFRRCSEEEFQRNTKPGRQMIAILLGINLAGWVVKSFQLKEADILYSMTDSTPYAWVLIAIAMPVYLFYRYHCTVCLSQAFTILYEDETHRFEVLWRQNPIYLANLLSHSNLAFCENSHLHAGEKIGHPPDRSLSQALHHKLSSQSFHMDNAFSRRTSFFNPQGMSMQAVDSLHDLGRHSTSGDVAGILKDPLSKFSVPCFYRKSSVVNLRRVSLVNIHHAKAPVGLQHSESFEGPNYFLSHGHKANNSPSAFALATCSGMSEHATQTCPTVCESVRPDRHEASGQQLTSYSKYCAQHQLSPCHLQHSDNNKILLAYEDKNVPDRMQRRQTLFNLETAKYRFLAAEMVHKRVLDRAHNGNVNSGVKKHKRSTNKEARDSRKMARVNADLFRPNGGARNGGQLTSESEATTDADGAVATDIEQLENQASPAVSHSSSGYRRTSLVPGTKEVAEPETVEQVRPPPARGPEPSKVLPLLIATNGAQGFLTSVPEESHDSRTSEVSSESGMSPVGEPEARNISSLEVSSSSPSLQPEVAVAGRSGSQTPPCCSNDCQTSSAKEEPTGSLTSSSCPNLSRS
uniref:Otopetrin n=1 Tax=Schistocephalus solidus TaxID=70667 RepID=A0A0X3PRV1_SCHSO